MGSLSHFKHTWSILLPPQTHPPSSGVKCDLGLWNVCQAGSMLNDHSLQHHPWLLWLWTLVVLPQSTEVSFASWSFASWRLKKNSWSFASWSFASWSYASWCFASWVSWISNVVLIYSVEARDFGTSRCEYHNGTTSKRIRLIGKVSHEHARICCEAPSARWRSLCQRSC